MFGAKDIVYSILIAAALTYLLHYRPLFAARAVVKDDALAGFQNVYNGYRFLNGDVVVPEGSSGVQTDALRPVLKSRRLNIEASHLEWNGRTAEFYVNHVVRLVGTNPGGVEVGRRVHIKLRRTSSGWVYELFQARGSDPDQSSAGNPWVLALSDGLRDR